MVRFNIMSHRGGQTDKEIFHNTEFNRNKPPENTLPALRQVLEAGADGIEVDVVRTKDDKLAVIHSATLKDHVFNLKPHDFPFVSYYTMAELKEKFRVGPQSDGIIPELSEVLELCEEFQARGKRITFNIEMKDVKGTPLPKNEHTSVVPLLSKYIEASSLKRSNIIFSSFSLEDVKDASKLNLGVKLALLFDRDVCDGRIIYANTLKDKCIGFTEESIKRVFNELKTLTNAHAEIGTVTPEKLKLLNDLGITLGTWTNDEVDIKNRTEEFKTLVENINKQGMEPYIITNFIKDWKGLSSPQKEGPETSSFVEKLAAESSNQKEQEVQMR